MYDVKNYDPYIHHRYIPLVKEYLCMQALSVIHFPL